MTAVKTTMTLPVAPTSEAAPFAIRAERPSDAAAREALLDVCFGPGRFARTCQRLRDGRKPAEGLAFVAVRRGPVSRIRSSQDLPLCRERTAHSIGTPDYFDCACGSCFGNSPRETCSNVEGNFRNATRIMGTVRLWHVSAGGRPALMLGPLAVDPACRQLGLGAALMEHALAAAAARGHGAVVLLGDAPYYARFGFSAEATAALTMPGPFERDRLLACELRDGALDGAAGMIAATGAALAQPRPAVAATRRAA